MRKRARPSLTEDSGCGHFWTEIRSPRMRARCRLHAYTIERYKVGARKKASHVVADLRRAAGDVYDQRSGTTNERGCATYTRTKLRAECRFSWYVHLTTLYDVVVEWGDLLVPIACLHDVRVTLCLLNLSIDMNFEINHAYDFLCATFSCQNQ